MRTYITNISKSSILFLFIALLPISINAQNQIKGTGSSKEQYKKLDERIRERSKGLIEQPSPYDEKKRNVTMNPMMPFSRDVSQHDSLDYGTIRILYAFNATDITNPSTYDDLQRLEIGQTHVKYYSYYVYQADSCATRDVQESNKIFNSNFQLEVQIDQALAMQGKHQGWSQYLFSEFFKDLTKNELTEYCRMPEGLKRYNSYYTETIPTQEWQIAEETMEIAGYTCQKATCRFRGRNYTAWFAVDIPISQGPWKFGGLPGLILKVYDDKQEYVFECVGIEQHAQAYPIILLDNYKDYRKTTRSKLDKLLKSVCENYYQLSGLTKTVSKRLFPYNPMELK